MNNTDKFYQINPKYAKYEDLLVGTGLLTPITWDEAERNLLLLLKCGDIKQKQIAIDQFKHMYIDRSKNK